MNIGRTGFYAKYSLVDWDTKRNVRVHHQFDFIVSQATLGYKFIPTSIDKLVNIYTAALYNHRARGLTVSDHKKANVGGYLGFSVGQAKIAGDWVFEAMYQVLGAQTIPDFDNNGVGLGNSDDNGFYYTRDKKAKDGFVRATKETAEGNVNYRAFQLNLQYLITNNINIFQQWQQSITLDKDIGPFRRYKQYEIDFIYNF